MTEPLYELRKDVDMPGRYCRAGVRKTEKEFREEYHLPAENPFGWYSDWFIDLSNPQKREVDQIREIVEMVFTKETLHSITYKEAACECVRRALIILK